VPATTKISEFEAAIRSACEPIFEKPLAEISFGQILIYLFQTARRFDMEVQPSLVLLQKTLLNIEGLGRELYPELSLWDTAKPYLEKWHQDRYMPKNIIEQLRQYAPQWLEHLPQVPDMVFESLNQGGNLNDLVGGQQAQLNKVRGELTAERQHRKRLLTGTVVIAAGLAIAQPQILANITALPPLSIGLFIIAAVILLRP
jgi:ubiquinone biosynthesis protein